MVFKYKEKQGHDCYTILNVATFGERVGIVTEGAHREVFGMSKFYFLTCRQGSLLCNSLSFVWFYFRVNSINEYRKKIRHIHTDSDF